MLNLFNQKYSVSSDEELMLLVTKGNEKAFNELYKRYSKNLLYFFYQRLYRDNERAQDFLQDLFLKIIEKADLFNPDQKFKIWLYSMAANMCKNEYRKVDVRGIKVDDYDFSQLIEDLPSSQLSNKFDKDLFLNTLAVELRKLDESQSLTFILRYKQHLSIKEISQIMECAEGTVKSRLFYTIQKLSLKLEIFNPYTAN